MSVFTVEGAWGRGALRLADQRLGYPSRLNGPVLESGGGHTPPRTPDDQLKTGWWLLPSVLFGAALWIWMIDLALGLFQIQTGLHPLSGA